MSSVYRALGRQQQQQNKWHQNIIPIPANPHLSIERHARIIVHVFVYGTVSAYADVGGFVCFEMHKIQMVFLSNEERSIKHQSSKLANKVLQ